jgi:hypothetical protein
MRSVPVELSPRVERAASKSLSRDEISSVVQRIVETTKFIDLHTHLFAPQFGALGLWGIDELLTYHYLEAELFRVSPLRPADYWLLTKPQQADLIWRTLFIENSPVSEATRGVVAVLGALGLDTASPTLAPLRDFFRAQSLEAHISCVFAISGIESVVMTNDPLDPAEARFWTDSSNTDPRFRASLRLDRIVNDWDRAARALQSQNYHVDSVVNERTIGEVGRFLLEWSARMDPAYMAVSLPDSFQYPLNDARTQLLACAVLPVCRDLKIPLALMIGVRRQVNPALRLAGDAAGRADLRALEALCSRFPENRFLVTVLSRENQHELCVYARKFNNLMPFGCWWFLNNTSIVEEITRERVEMLGTSFIPQHSDARILEQLIYKWRTTRRVVSPILAERYRLLMEDGHAVTEEQIRRDVTRLFRSNFEEWTAQRQSSTGRISM